MLSSLAQSSSGSKLATFIDSIYLDRDCSKLVVYDARSGNLVLMLLLYLKEKCFLLNAAFLKHLYKTTVTEAVYISSLYDVLWCYIFYLKSF